MARTNARSPCSTTVSGGGLLRCGPLGPGHILRGWEKRRGDIRTYGARHCLNTTKGVGNCATIDGSRGQAMAQRAVLPC